MSKTMKRIKGGPELQKILDELPVRMERNFLRAGLRAGGAVVRDEARKNINNVTGALSKSVRVSTRSRGGQVKAIVRAGNKEAFYAHMVEFGTAPHMLNKGVDNKSKVLNIAGNLVGGKVMHPGAKAKPFLRPAVDENQSQIVKAVGERIKARIAKEGLTGPVTSLEVDE